MKRLFAVMVVLIMAGTAVYGAGPFFGAKLGMGIGFHGDGEFMEDSVKTLKDLGISVDEKSGAAFVMSPYLGYYFTDKVAVQTEFNFMFGQKKTWEMSYGGQSVGEIEGKYSSLDVPFLLRFDFINKPALFGILAGPYVSLPLGNIEMSTSVVGEGSQSGDVEPDGVTAGIAAGLYGGYPIGPGRIIGDVRFIMDFNAIKDKEGSELLKRRGINITVGYEFLFGGN
ncbi:MAG: outer membrane beta-barrel protein [Spirochaetaceae bacterium]|jgi:hypothetical protein|nr:outer membrane beta-barrel protein [Spirochaetaceae bacterium]